LYLASAIRRGWREKRKGKKKMGKRASKATPVEPASTKEVRAWLLENNVDGVGTRGRLKPEHIEQFTQATKRPVATQ